ncbi:hypothetical protein PoB_003438800 [Plakobranchus ocellatus]|uniref:Uncharacterized protein n=1 Tax=Plakobranchus ocellatus TaxID=259542 RepID=A0AAV4AKQ5_9GAST|nr:hypothetical protein PoB_003438800 [Plakobranchus ocellatus]
MDVSTYVPVECIDNKIQPTHYNTISNQRFPVELTASSLPYFKVYPLLHDLKPSFPVEFRVSSLAITSRYGAKRCKTCGLHTISPCANFKQTVFFVMEIKT